jgi:hypothetical protein
MTEREPGPWDPTIVICMDLFGPLNLQTHPGLLWAPVAGKVWGTMGSPRRRCWRATNERSNEAWHLMTGSDLSTAKRYSHVTTKMSRSQFLAVIR